MLGDVQFKDPADVRSNKPRVPLKGHYADAVADAANSLQVID